MSESQIRPMLTVEGEKGKGEAWMGEVGYMSESQIRPMLTVEVEKGKGEAWMGEVGYMSESQIRPMLTVEGEKGKCLNPRSGSLWRSRRENVGLDG